MLTHARRLGSWFVFMFANKYNIPPRQNLNSPANVSSIRGLQLDCQSDRLELEHDDFKVMLHQTKIAQHPRQHVVVLQFVVDNTHRNALSSMLKGLGNSE